jgi:hypothetical protein
MKNKTINTHEEEVDIPKFPKELIPNSHHLKLMTWEEFNKVGTKHHQYGIPITDEAKKKIRETNINNAIRTDRDGVTILPKYMKYVKWKTEEGYHIVSHPRCKLRKFVSTLNVNDGILDGKKKEALEFLKNLNLTIGNNKT